jgi:hypothetical protein
MSTLFRHLFWVMGNKKAGWAARLTGEKASALVLIARTFSSIATKATEMSLTCCLRAPSTKNLIDV